MMRQIVLPAAILLACLVGVFGFFLWDEFHAQRGLNLAVEDAEAGNLTVQRNLASCYATGCSPSFVREPILACAWREIITGETKPASHQDLSALHEACSRLSTTDRNVLNSAEEDIRLRMSRIQPTRLRPKHADAGAHAPEANIPHIAPMAPHGIGTVTARHS